MICIICNYSANQIDIPFLYRIGCPEGYLSLQGDISNDVLEHYKDSIEACKTYCDENENCKAFRHVDQKEPKCTLLKKGTPDTLWRGDFMLCKKQGINGQIFHS